MVADIFGRKGITMAQIIELPEVLANQIAAGEVIERPSSVVKELVENSIDANSSQIIVEVEESGLKKIQVTDNGDGISFEELPLSIRRHATSKIKTQSDLFRIRSLGFRGEALPSIASVSKMTIISHREDEQHGGILEVKGGEIESHDIYTTPAGTKISVENLFYNTPARLKYMRSLQAELSHVVDIINRLSLAHPNISFTLLSDGRQLIKTAGSGDLRQAIAGVYGLNTAKKMVEISASDLDFEINGYVSLPELTRANRNYITILINGRYIKNFLLNRAILDGYGSKLMVGRFPIAVVSIEIDPYLADVNVHPTKQEVRISKEKELMALIQEAISEALKEEDLIPDALENLSKSKRGQEKEKVEQTTLPLQSGQLYYDKEKQDFFTFGQVSEPTSRYNGLFEKPDSEDRVDVGTNAEELRQSTSVRFAQRSEEEVTDFEHPSIRFTNKREQQKLGKIVERLDNETHSQFPELEYFGQMHGTYLFAQGKEGLYIVDQHAAQERVKYEYYRESIGNVDTGLQQLLIPYLFEFPKDDFLRLKENMSVLNEVGINLEDYGENTFILREHPTWFKESEIESAVYEMCDMLLLTNEVSIKRYRAELAIMMSCKRSIKANHALDDQSARHLLVELSHCKNPYNCPHGRPVLVHFTPSDMEKMFRRIQENHQSMRELGKY